MERNVTCILNGASGSGQAEETEALISRVAFDLGAQVRVLISRTGSDIEALAREARENGGIVAAGGGDGTISAVAGVLVDSGIPLGVLPLGTLNHFAKDLKIPLDMEEAIHTLFTGPIGQVDIGDVNGRVFLNNSSIGIYPRIVREREALQKRGNGKWISFARALAHVLRQDVALRVELETARADRVVRDTPFVFVGNNAYHVSGLEIGERDALDKGALWVCAAPRTGRFRLFRLAVTALLGQAGKEDLVTFDTRAMTIHVRTPMVSVSTDGEVTAMDTPLRYRIRAGALRVVLPAPAQEA